MEDVFAWLTENAIALGSLSAIATVLTCMKLFFSRAKSATPPVQDVDDHSTDRSTKTENLTTGDRSPLQVGGGDQSTSYDAGTVINNPGVVNLTQATPRPDRSRQVNRPTLLGLSREKSVHFVGRDAEMAALAKQLFDQSNSRATTSLAGLAGIGKTELAVQFVRNADRECSFPGGIYWFDAEEKDLTGQWATMASERGFAGSSAGAAAGLIAEINAMQDRVLVVFDNVDTWPPVPAVPTGTNVCTLITTRDSDIGGSSFATIELGFLEEGAARELIGRISGRTADSEEWNGLLTHLRGHALAIELAGACLHADPEESPSDCLNALIEDGDIEQEFKDQPAYDATVNENIDILSPSITGEFFGLAGQHITVNAQPLIKYGKWLQAQHGALAPLFANAALDLATVYVELDVRVSENEPKTLLVGEHEPKTLRNLMCLQADEEPVRWVLFGEPGAGKSTLVRNLVHQLGKALANQETIKAVPMVFSLASIARCRGSLFNVLKDQLLDTGIDENDALAIEERLTKLGEKPGDLPLWVFLDGLDEVVGGDLAGVKEKLRNWAEQMPSASICVLSRRIGYTEIGFSQYHHSAEVQLLGDGQQEEMLVKWLSEPQPVLDHLRGNLMLRDVCRTPLMMSLLAYAALRNQREGSALPKGRLSLLRTGLDRLISRDYAFAPTEQGVNTRQIELPKISRQLLQELAFTLQDKGDVQWTNTVLLKHMSTWEVESRGATALNTGWQGDAKTCLKQLELCSGLLRPMSEFGDQWHFMHRQFHEMLTAEALHTRGLAALKAFVARLKDDDDLPRWSESLGLCCALFDLDIEGAEKLPQLKALKILQNVNPEIARQALRDVDKLPPTVAVEFLLGLGVATDHRGGFNVPLRFPDGWDGDDLENLLERYGEMAAERLWHAVKPGLPLEALGSLLFALESVCGEHPEQRRRFFQQARLQLQTGAEKPPSWCAIPAGTFEMGDQTWSDSKSLNTVELAAFDMAQHPVTVGEFSRMRRPSRQPDENDANPVVDISWWVAFLYCRWLGDDVHLPTESRWEYACRAGSSAHFCFGDDEKKLEEYAWYGNRGGAVHVVEQLRPNAWGLYDMHGNVFEWCLDGRANDSYRYPVESSTGHRTQPRVAPRVLRGGSWPEDALHCRSGHRDWGSPGQYSIYRGFRPARTLR